MSGTRKKSAVDRQAGNAEARVQLGDAFVDSILPGLSACVIVLDLDGNVLLLCNGGLVEAENGQIKGNQGDHWPDIWVGPDQGVARKAFARARDGAVERFEARTTTHSGGEYTWDIVIHFVVSDGAAGRLIAICRNVTDHRRAEAQANDKAALLEMTLAHMDQGLVLIDDRQHVRLFNPRATELLGIPLEWVAENPHFECMRDFLEAAGGFSDVDETTRALIYETDFRKATLTYERTRPCGQRIEVRSVPLPNGAVLRTISDLTARRRAESELQASEARYRALVEASSTLVWRADCLGFGTHTVASGRFSAYTDAAFDGYNWLDLVHPDDRQELAVAIGEAMLANVTLDLRSWLDLGLPCGRVSINLSTAEFCRPDLAAPILARLSLLSIAPEHFEVEVTENVFLGRDTNDVSKILERFHASGIKVALDDFGTDYASLTHLKRFPVDEIKIDKSFVRDMQQDAGDTAIVSAVIGLGKSLGKTVIAEGVETIWQVDHLRRQGCDYAQGFHYSKPMVASRVPWFVEHNRQEREGQKLENAR